MKRVLLSCGNGGLENQALIHEVFMKYFKDFTPYAMEDSGRFSGDNFVVSTDSYTISPIFFKGGDIGKLSVCGSCNDCAMMGAAPKYLTASFIIEEGFLISDLEKIAKSMSEEIILNDLVLLSADTKVVARGEINGIFITTTAIGESRDLNVSAKNLQSGDVIISSGAIGLHGACIYCLRNNIALQSDIHSDCTCLWSLVETLLSSGIEIHAMRDATRGGIASVLNEWANSSNCDINIYEEQIIIPNEVKGVCEILGLDVYSLANEGICIFSIPKEHSIRALEILKSNALGKNAFIFGEVLDSSDKKVILNNAWGAKRYLDYPQGELLPRIC